MEKIRVMVAGLPGKMATLVAQAIADQKDMELAGTGLSEESDGIVKINSWLSVQLAPISGLENALGFPTVDMIVDFTLPKSVNANAERYCRWGTPFVMGTTGGDRKKLVESVEKSEVSAVIATNMASPIVVFQSMLRHAAESFPGSFAGWKLVVVESHQAQKPDPSGTAIGLLDYFAELGTPLKPEQIVMVRNPEAQEVVLGVPQGYLDGHGYHTYTLQSPDGTVMLQFKHNILGRNVYVDGALRAIRFLGINRQASKGKVFSMIDVLKG
jgi:4-hydroxy-tetrahydrodipicolinate reductase